MNGLKDEEDGRIDGALRRAFDPPGMSKLIAGIQQRAAGSRRRWPWLALAAALLVAGFVLWAEGSRPDPGQESLTRSDGSTLAASWVDAYRDAVARGFDTPGCCDPKSSLGERCRELFAATVEIRGNTNVQVCGAYCGRSAGGAVAMLARSGEEPVCLFILPRKRAPELGRDHGVVIDGVTIHRRDLGELVVFEVSRSKEPHLLQDLYLP